MLNYIDVVIIVASMLLVIGVGAIAGRKRGDTAHGYFLGGNKMPWWLIGTAFVATGISSEQMIGTVGVTYDMAWASPTGNGSACPATRWCWSFFIPIYLKNKVTTVPGFLADRFGPAVGTTYSCMLLFLYVCVYMVTVLYAGSLAFSNIVFDRRVTWWQTVLVLLLIAVGVGAYTIHGGLTSVMWADLFQCILLMVGGITLFSSPWTTIPGGWAGLVRAQGSASRTHAHLPTARSPHGAFPGMLIATFGGVHLLSGGQPGDDPAHVGRPQHLGRPDGPDAGPVHQLLAADGHVLPRPGRLSLDQCDAPIELAPLADNAIWPSPSPWASSRPTGACAASCWPG